MRTVFLLLLAVSLFTGCALSPQTITINPDIAVKKTGIKKETTIYLDVVDKRSSPVIGERGGVYRDTSTITTAQDMTDKLHDSLTRAMQDLGYQVVTDSATARARLTVNITDISYQAKNENLLTKIITKVEIQGVIIKNRKEFTGTYTATRKKDFVKTPNELENEDIVNDALALVLKNMLEDPDFIQFIDE